MLYSGIDDWSLLCSWTWDEISDGSVDKLRGITGDIEGAVWSYDLIWPDGATFD